MLNYQLLDLKIKKKVKNMHLQVKLTTIKHWDLINCFDWLSLSCFSLTHSPTHPPIHPPTHSCTHSLTHLLTPFVGNCRFSCEIVVIEPSNKLTVPTRHWSLLDSEKELCFLNCQVILQLNRWIWCDKVYLKGGYFSHLNCKTVIFSK